MTDLWKERRVFVTGASGFVGANLVRALVDSGAEVICLERDETQPNSLDMLSLRQRVTVVRGSVDDLQTMSRVLNEYDVQSVFHLAAQALVGAANRSPISTFESNIRGTYMLLEACRLSPSVDRVVVASSDKAYGSHSELPYSEGHRLNAVYPYDVSKACTDLISISFAKTFGLRVAVTRSANIYGPADMNMSRIIPGTILSILRGERPIIRSDGTPVRDFIFTDDIVAGYLLLAERIDEATGQAFNFGTQEPISMSDLVIKILSLMGRDVDLKPHVLLSTKIANEIDAQYLSSAKVAEMFGWRARVTLDEGLRRTIEWYQRAWESGAFR